MSKKRISRRKAAPRKRRRITFRLAIDAQEMLVTYKPDAFEGMAQFDFRSTHRPPRRIVVSETGYRCHFAAMEEVEAAGGPEAFARQAALDIWQSQRRVKDDPAQGTLFERRLPLPG